MRWRLGRVSPSSWLHGGTAQHRRRFSVQIMWRLPASLASCKGASSGAAWAACKPPAGCHAVLSHTVVGCTHCMLRMALAGLHQPCTSGLWGMRRMCWARQAEGRTQTRNLQDRQVGGRAAACVTSCLNGCMRPGPTVNWTAAAGCWLPVLDAGCLLLSRQHVLANSCAGWLGPARQLEAHHGGAYRM